MIHIISSGNKWGIYKKGNKRMSKLFKYREQAYHYAKQITNNIVVHNKNGSVLFKETI